MGTIKNFIENIKKARYGKDVRQSIIDAIEQTYSDAISNGHTDMEVAKARDTYNDLNSRLEADKNKMEAKLTNEEDDRKRTLEDIQKQVNGLAREGHLVASNISEMTDTNRTYINTEDGHWYYYNGSWKDGGVYQATEIENGDIIVEKTDFAKRINCFNYIKTQNARLQKYIGNLYNVILPSEDYRTSELYKINEGDTVRLKFPNTATFTLGVAWCDKSKKMIKIDLFDNWTTSAEFVAPESAEYFEFDLNITNSIDWTKDTMCTINKEMPTNFVEYNKYIFENCEQITRLEENMNAISTKIRNVVYNPTKRTYILKNYIGQRNIPFKNLLIGYNADNYRLKSRVNGYENYGYCGDYITFKDNANLTKPFSMIRKDDFENIELSYKDIVVISVDPEIKSNPKTQKNVLIIGDSFTQEGYLPWYIQNFVKTKYGFSNFNFIGHKTFTNDNVSVKHSGCGGYTVKDFIKIDNTEGRGTVYSNPFLKNGTVAISNAITEVPDICVIELGVNDLLDNHTTTQLVNDLSNFITIIKNSNSNCTIYLVGYIYMSEINNFMNDVDHNLKVQEFNKAIENFANINSYNFIDVSTMFNRDIGYKYQEVEIYPGSEKIVRNQIDYLHPGQIGYKMEAENIAAKLIYDLDNKVDNN